MRVLLVANINSSHTRKWALALKQRNIAVALFSIDPPNGELPYVHDLELAIYPMKKDRFLPRKYYRLYRSLKQTILKFNPDIIHSHYLTNYTFLANYSRFRPHLATAWGSDVYAFPREGSLQKAVLKYNLKHAGTLISTSHNMAKEMQSYVNREVRIIPFGIDFSLFPVRRVPALSNPRKVVIGCFKKIEKIYGHEDLVLAFSILREKFQELDLQLVIAGTGSQLNEIRTMASYLGMSSAIRFTGWIDPAKVPKMLEEIDICVYLSKHESFGVSLLEAMAAKVPLVVSATPGFIEVVGGEEHALVVPVGDPIKAAEKIGWMITHPDEARQMAERAYVRAQGVYELKANIDSQVELYKSTLEKKKI